MASTTPAPATAPAPTAVSVPAASTAPAPATATVASERAAPPSHPAAESGDRPRNGRLRRLAPLGALLAGLVVLLTAMFTGPAGMTPDEVARSAHDQVMREVIERTGDYSMAIGPLDCVELAPGRGNCLADARSGAHRADGLMVAVGYTVDPGNGQLDLAVRLP